MMTRRLLLVGLFLLGLLLADCAGAVERNKFKTCKDSGFCRRNRDRVAGEMTTATIAEAFRRTADGAARANVAEAPPKSDAEPSTRTLAAEVRAYDGGVLRVSVFEAARTDSLAPRFRADAAAIEPSLRAAPLSLRVDEATGRTLAGNDGATVALPAPGAPFSFDFFVDDEADAAAAIRAGALLFENHAPKPPPPPPPPPPPAEETDAEKEQPTAEPTTTEEEAATEEPPMAEEAAAAAEEEAATHEEEEEEGVPMEEEDYDTAAMEEDVHSYAMAEHGTAVDEPPPPSETPAAPGEIDGGWDEYFGGATDSKPNGPGAVGLDIEFPKAEMLYGIPEHATSMALRNTRGEGEGAYSQPYRLYNLDVCEYELNEPMALYGAVPLILAHGATSGTTVGMLWLNPTETWVDVNGTPAQTKTRWTSEDGVVDVWLLPGPTPSAVFEQYARITGRMPLPPKFSIAYHQCRWNYRDEKDVAEVDAQFDAADFPYDVIWLDIEHTNGKRYLTWDTAKFPAPEKMQENLAVHGRKLVVIADPHIKRDENYHVHKQGMARKLFVKGSGGGDNAYEGSCWPGSSSWVDFLNPEARTWWGGLFALDAFQGSTDSLYLWNDMNEPSVFSGPEVTMHKDAIHHGGVEHRAVHNLYGLLNAEASYTGLLARSPNRRPFVLTRAFFAGSQRWAAVWTGDNAAKWEHLHDSLPMILSLGIGGIPFVGADVGGFFGNPDTELLVRWYQAGAWYPFFRAHAHIETKRREPYLFDNKTVGILRDAVRTRYAMLPYWYTAFHETSRTGLPIARALWIEFPRDARVLSADDEYMVGSSVLVHPVTAPGKEKERVYLPAGVWYDTFSLERVRGPTEIDVATPLERGAPAFYRGGHIVPRQERPRRSSALMSHDPFTLVVALDGASRAHGKLYMDDGISLDHTSKDAFSLTEFSFEDGVLSATQVASGFSVPSGLERVVVAGLAAAPKKVVAEPGGACSFGWNAATHTLIVKKPLPDSVSVASSWRLALVN